MSEYTDVQIRNMAMKVINKFGKIKNELWYDGREGEVVSLYIDEIAEEIGVPKADRDTLRRVKAMIVALGENLDFGGEGYFFGDNGAPGNMFVNLYHMKEGLENCMDLYLEASAINQDTFQDVIRIIEEGTGKSMKQLEAGNKRKWSNIVKVLLGSGE